MEVTELCFLTGEETFEFAMSINVLGLPRPLLGALKQQKCIRVQPRRVDVCSQGVSRTTPSLERTLPASSSAWWPRAFLGLQKHNCSLCLSLPMVSFPVSLCVLSPSYKTVSHCRGLHPHTVGPHCGLTTQLQRPYSQKDHILRFPVDMHFGEILFHSPYSDMGHRLILIPSPQPYL